MKEPTKLEDLDPAVRAMLRGLTEEVSFVLHTVAGKLNNHFRKTDDVQVAFVICALPMVALDGVTKPDGRPAFASAETLVLGNIHPTEDVDNVTLAILHDAIREIEKRKTN